MKPHWIFFTILFLCSYLVFEMGALLEPFIIAAILGYMLQPVVRKLQKLQLPKWSASLVVIILIVSVVVAILVVSLPLIYNQLFSLLVKFPAYIEQFRYLVDEGIEKSHAIPKKYISLFQDSIHSSLKTLTSFLTVRLGTLLESSLSILHFLSFLVFVPLIGFYFTKDWDSILKTLLKHVPPAYVRTTLLLMKEVDEVLSSFARGQSLICLCLAFYYGVSLYVLGVDFGSLIGILTGVFAFVPYVGAITGFVISAIISLVQSGDWLFGATGSPALLLCTTLVFSFGQVLDGVILTPNILGKRIKLHPVWILFSLFVSGYILGFKGIFIATPLAGVIGVLVRYSLRKYRTLFLEK